MSILVYVCIHTKVFLPQVAPFQRYSLSVVDFASNHYDAPNVNHHTKYTHGFFVPEKHVFVRVLIPISNFIIFAHLLLSLLPTRDSDPG